jgi:hypothetical protein
MASLLFFIFLCFYAEQKGRNNAMANRNRRYRLSVYLDENEKYILENKVKISGARSKGAFLRNLIIYGYVYDVDYKYLRDYSTELNRIGTLLNQIAKRVNTNGNIYQAEMQEVKELMEKIWHTHESMLSKQPLINR